MIRAQRYAQVKALRDQGFVQREISERTGLARSTVGDLLNDPTGEKARARKAKTHGTCKDCGAKTFNGGSPHVPERCRPCAHARVGDMDRRRAQSAQKVGQVIWSDDDLVTLVRRIAVNGRISKPMWLEAREKDSSIPSFNFTRRFDTWSALCAKAGVEPVGRAKGPYRNRISAEECLRWVQRCADDIGRVPPCWVYEDWHYRHEGSPSQSTIRNRFGTWMSVAERVVVPSDLVTAA